MNPNDSPGKACRTIGWSVYFDKDCDSRLMTSPKEMIEVQVNWNILNPLLHLLYYASAIYPALIINGHAHGYRECDRRVCIEFSS